MQDLRWGTEREIVVVLPHSPKNKQRLAYLLEISSETFLYINPYPL